MSQKAENLKTAGHVESSPIEPLPEPSPQDLHYPEIQPSRAMLFGLALCLFLFGLGIRLHHIASDTLQPDEHHWVVRSKKILANFEAHRFSRLTSHLGHPGVTPAVVMSFAQWLGRHWNERRHYLAGNPRYIDQLTISRIAMAVTASLLFPIFFLLACSLAGFEVSLIATIFLVLSPSHIGLSRMAHLDTFLTLLVTLTVLCYAIAERKRAPWYKLLAGVFWGLSVATKPTAGFLIPGFLAYRIIRKVLFKDRRHYPLISWADIWAILAGHVVLACVYTRLWEPNSRYVYKFHIQNIATQALLSLGGSLEGKPVFIAANIVVITLSVFLLLRERVSRSRFRFHLLCSTTLVGCLLLAVSTVPVVLANIVRFWTWSAGLTHVTHVAYNMVWTVPQYGYLSLLFGKFPALAIIGLVLGLVFLFQFRGGNQLENERRLFYLFCLMIPVVWVGFLSMSTKQSYRYLMPVLPCLYLLAAFGLFRVFLFLVRRREHYREMFCGFAALIFVSQGAVALSWRPLYLMYGNMFSGGIESELHSGRPLPVAGIEGAIQYVQNNAQSLQQERWVSVLGDIDILLYTYRHLYPTSRQSVKFVPYISFVSGDFLLVFPSFQSKLSEILGDRHQQLTLSYSYTFKGSTLLSLYQLPIPDYKTPYRFNILKAARNTGHGVSFGPRNQHGVIVTPASDKADYILFGLNVRLKQGRYVLSFPVALPNESPSLDPDTQVVRLELGQCERIVVAREVTKDIHALKFYCEFEETANRQLRAYWFGKASLFLGNPTIQSKVE